MHKYSLNSTNDIPAVHLIDFMSRSFQRVFEDFNIEVSDKISDRSGEYVGYMCYRYSRL